MARVLSKSNTLDRLVNHGVDFKTNILIVGGAYSGLSAAKSILNHIEKRSTEGGKSFPSEKISITIIEPRSGLLNILGIPKSITNLNFADTQFIPFDELNSFHFDSVVSSSQNVLKRFENAPILNSEFCTFNYIHGKVTCLTTEKADYTLVDSDMKSTVDFDYVILATGRTRDWPTTPDAYDKEYYLNEMKMAERDIEKSNIISIIGAGAVGIEYAGDIKTKYPNKEVNLIHPHKEFPPEPLSIEFSNEIAGSLSRAGVNLILNRRIAKELENKNLLTTEGELIPSDLNYWCISKHNNIDILSEELRKDFISPQKNVFVNQYLQLSHNNKVVPHFFCIGDLIESPIIKSAGWAMYMGRQVANNLISLISDNVLVEPFPDITQMPRGMVIVGGNNEIISELCEVVELNNSSYVVEYQDYCIGKVRATLGI